MAFFDMFGSSIELIPQNTGRLDFNSRDNDDDTDIDIFLSPQQVRRMVSLLQKFLNRKEEEA